MPNRAFVSVPLLLLLAFALSARDTLSDEQLKLLQDPGGWEYITLSDSDNGIQTKHTCFDGQPHPGDCSGRIILTAGNTFVQNVHIHGQSVQRRGTYQISGNELTLADELGTKDGPYTLDLNTQTKFLIMQMPQVRIELELEKEYRKPKRKQSSIGRTRNLSASR